MYISSSLKNPTTADLMPSSSSTNVADVDPDPPLPSIDRISSAFHEDFFESPGPKTNLPENLEGNKDGLILTKSAPEPTEDEKQEVPSSDTFVVPSEFRTYGDFSAVLMEIFFV